MNLPEAELEKILRAAPKMKAPAGLKERLLSEARNATATEVNQSAIRRQSRLGWARRWWPAFGPAVISVACAVVLAVQQQEIQALKSALDSSVATNEAAPKSVNELNASETEATPGGSGPSEKAEIERLTTRVNELKAELARLEQMRTENERLRTELATPAIAGLSAEETEAVAKAQEKAQFINCINNLKQFGMAVRLWAMDNDNLNSPNILSMSNELSTPKILICPADTGRQEAPNWSLFTPANCSYDYLAPSDASDKEPLRALSRCPIHGSIGLCDGSVQGGIGKTHPEWLVQRDGKLYLETTTSNPQPNSKPESKPTGFE